MVDPSASVSQSFAVPSATMSVGTKDSAFGNRNEEDQRDQKTSQKINKTT